MQEKLIEIAKTLDIHKYFCYVETPDNHRLSLSSGDVALWITAEYYQKFGSAPDKKAVENLVYLLTALQRFHKPLQLNSLDKESN